jgi:hypothetical protein
MEPRPQHPVLRLAVAGIVASLALLAACKGKDRWSTYHYERHGYRIDHPSDWTPSDLPGIQMVMGPHLQIMRLSPLAFMTIQRVTGGQETLEAAVDGEVAETRNALVPTQVERQKDTTIGGLPTKVVLVRHAALKGVAGAKARTSLIHYVRRAPTIWKLDCSVEADRLEQDRPVCTRMAASLRFD